MVAVCRVLVRRGFLMCGHFNNAKLGSEMVNMAARLRFAGCCYRDISAARRAHQRAQADDTQQQDKQERAVSLLHNHI